MKLFAIRKRTHAPCGHYYRLRGNSEGRMRATWGRVSDPHLMTFYSATEAAHFMVSSEVGFERWKRHDVHGTTRASLTKEWEIVEVREVRSVVTHELVPADAEPGTDDGRV